MTVSNPMRPHWRTLLTAAAAMAACTATFTQAQEVQGGAAATGSPVS